MDHPVSIESLAVNLKKARADKRLSQRELSAEISVPQSHISKIENGKVDLQASSLIELARALDLELMLVPRNLVPALAALMTHPAPVTIENRVKDSAEAKALDALEKARKEAKRLSHRIGSAAELKRFIAAAQDLERFRFLQPQIDQIQDALTQLKTPYEVLKRASVWKKSAHDLFANDQVRRALREYALVGDQIRSIRNLLAHGALPSGLKSIPAYRLSDGDDDA